MLTDPAKPQRAAVYIYHDGRNAPLLESSLFSIIILYLSGAYNRAKINYLAILIATVVQRQILTYPLVLDVPYIQLKKDLG